MKEQKLTKEQTKRLMQFLKIILAFNSQNVLEKSPTEIFDTICWAISKKEEPERIKEALDEYCHTWGLDYGE